MSIQRVPGQPGLGNAASQACQPCLLHVPGAQRRIALLLSMCGSRACVDVCLACPAQEAVCSAAAKSVHTCKQRGIDTHGRIPQPPPKAETAACATRNLNTPVTSQVCACRADTELQSYMHVAMRALGLPTAYYLLWSILSTCDAHVNLNSREA